MTGENTLYFYFFLSNSLSKFSEILQLKNLLFTLNVLHNLSNIPYNLDVLPLILNYFWTILNPAVIMNSSLSSHNTTSFNLDSLKLFLDLILFHIYAFFCGGMFYISHHNLISYEIPSSYGFLILSMSQRIVQKYFDLYFLYENFFLKKYFMLALIFFTPYIFYNLFFILLIFLFDFAYKIFKLLTFIRSEIKDWAMVKEAIIPKSYNMNWWLLRRGDMGAAISF